MIQDKGILYIVGVPIGNLQDITFRALEILKKTDWIACEDTRRTLKLLNHYGIQKSLLTIFGPKERNAASKILNLLSEGKSVALLTDSGTPGISDPGSFVVGSAREKGFSVQPVPGVSALTCALSVFGIPEDGFVFLGFLKRDKGKIKKELSEAAQLKRSVVFFESPYRIAKTLGIACELFGKETFCLVAREMTKKFEEYLSGRLGEIAEKIQNKENLGEFTVILNLCRKEKVN